MISDPELQTKIAETLKIWDDAEKAAKTSEQITGKVVLPTITELRYAGRKLGDALKAAEESADSEVVFQHLADARDCCERAKHDATDVAISHISHFVNVVFLQLDPLVLDGAKTEIVTLIKKLDEMHQKVAESRESRKDRSNIYTSLEIELREIQTDFLRLKTTMLETLEKNAERYSDEAIGSRQKDKFSGTLAIGAIVAALTAAMVSFLGIM